MNPKEIEIKDFNYNLPDERIAKFPVKQRDHSKLLVYRQGNVTDDFFYNLPDYLPTGGLMVYNNTRVIQARLHFRKETGALIEIFLLEPHLPADYEQMFQTRSTCEWQCLVGNAKKWKEGPLKRIVKTTVGDYELSATRDPNDPQIVRLSWAPVEGNDEQQMQASDELKKNSKEQANNSPQLQLSFAEILDAVGELPIPPYLNRESQESDKTTYQTVYSRIKGSVAAPTAGLHFTDAVLRHIDEKGIEREEVTLHVGAGTFKPVKSERIEGHEMHSEFICVNRKTIERLIAHEAKAIAVGTTSVRTLESLYFIGGKILANKNISADQLHVNQWEPYENGTPTWSALDALQAILDWLNRTHLKSLQTSTQIIIAPGYEYKIVKILITNFHQPQSTLLLLVSAFVKGDWRNIYDYALSHDFRFLSYGDSSILIP
ncbi:MAG: S-adenosylmethionine:tRNA ribosyltransferase-isomerase [Prevotella sp.]|nr:S-adenosylmethionine:tRNA ribosyltransferase-isomerase [Prevotella sp.]